MFKNTKALILFYVTLLLIACPYTFIAHAKGDGKMTNVKVLSIKGCEATPPTIDLVKSVAEELNINIKLTHVVVETFDQANKERFIGSPTVQINGLDIDLNAREIEHFGVT